MTLPATVDGISRSCPRCDADPDEPCVDRFGRTRATTHIERKDPDGT